MLVNGDDAPSTTNSTLAAERPTLKPNRPLDISLRLNARNLGVNYMAVTNQMLRQQQNTLQQLERYLLTLQNARDRSLRRINDEYVATDNRITRSNKLKNDEKQNYSTQLQNEVTNAQTDIQKIINDVQNQLRQSFFKLNTDSLHKLNQVFGELSKEQNKQIASIHQVNSDIPPKIQSNWAYVEKLSEEIRKKA